MTQERERRRSQWLPEGGGCIHPGVALETHERHKWTGRQQAAVEFVAEYRGTDHTQSSAAFPLHLELCEKYRNKKSGNENT